MCPECGQYVGKKPGEEVGEHQKPDSRERCPGSGKPATP